VLPHKNAGQNHNNKNKSFKKAAKLKCLGITITNQNFISEEIKTALHFWKSCCGFLKNFFYYPKI
jgi:hypothetical protein